ncbi:MAG: hypothetical protein ACMUEL_00590 [Flavobacteriales bacterium Tduv]
MLLSIEPNFFILYSKYTKQYIDLQIFNLLLPCNVLILFNKLVSKTRWVVERTFGSIKRWSGSEKAR